MKLPDDTLLTSKAVIELYQYKNSGNRSSALHYLLKRRQLPQPNVVTQQGLKRQLRWTVGYLKNYVKLPTELNILP